MTPVFVDPFSYQPTASDAFSSLRGITGSCHFWPEKNLFEGKGAFRLEHASREATKPRLAVWVYRAGSVSRGTNKPDHDISQWRDMATMSASWVDQGLTWYHGDAWYQTRFTLPADAAGEKDLRLWFGGFDYNVDVYLNGRPLGERKGFAMPAEYEGIAPLLLRDGRQNVLTVRVLSGDLAEIGTGVLMMPVMIYAPAGQPAGEKPNRPATPTQGGRYEM